MLHRARKRFLTWWKSLRGDFTLRDFVPARGLSASSLDPDVFVATDSDPQFRLSPPVLPGWYILEIRADLPSVHGWARIYLDTGRGESESLSFPAALRSGGLTKRLLRVTAPSRLRFDPTEEAGPLRILHLRLKRVTSGFARTRMVAKLAARDPLLPSRLSVPDRGDMHGVWTAYCEVLATRRDAGWSYPYDDWIRDVEPHTAPPTDAQRELCQGWVRRPRFSVLMPTWNTPSHMLRECLDSVLAQTYPEWELCIADDASTDPAVRRIVAEYESRDHRIRVVYRTENGHIAKASNSALELATGDFVALLDHDDTLAPHALFSIAEALQGRTEAKIVYSDEDKLDPSGRRCDPFFKPDFSPDLLRSQNYVAHLLVIDRMLVLGVGGFQTGYEGSQDYDLLLRCIDALAQPEDAVLHVARILYHWRISDGSTAAGHNAKPYASEAALRALQAHAIRLCGESNVTTVAAGVYRFHWPVPSPAPLVTVIIPTRDGGAALRTCIESIVRCTTYPAFEIIVVDNQSCQPPTLAYLQELHGSGAAKVLRYDHAFNYSAINNFAVRHAEGSVLALLNDDVEVMSPGWLTEMVSHAVRPDIGCVGAKLYYPDGSIQHAGVVLGIGGVAGHPWKYQPRHTAGYFNRLRTVHNVSAVTAAALVVRRDVFEAVGGLDAAALTVAFNDVDFCLKASDLGLRNLWTPFAELTHHESLTRGFDDTPERQNRFRQECTTMQARWGTRLRTDPFYNPHLTLRREDYSLAAPVERQ